MAIINCPDTASSRVASCVICHLEKPLSTLSAGMYDAEYCQAFACDDHFREPNRLIVGWADFIASERVRYLQLHADSLLSEVSDEWLVY